MTKHRLGPIWEPRPDVFTTKGTEDTRPDRKGKGSGTIRKPHPSGFGPCVSLAVRPTRSRAG
jgi:hypothetical protein